MGLMAQKDKKQKQQFKMNSTFNSTVPLKDKLLELSIMENTSKPMQMGYLFAEINAKLGQFS